MSNLKEGLALNNEEINYVLMAYICALHVKTHLKNNDFCLITDEGSLGYAKQLIGVEKLNQVFDEVMVTNDPLKETDQKNIRTHFDSPWTEFQAPFINNNKHEVFTISPYDKTILIDLDYLVLSNMLDSYFDLEVPFNMFSNAKTIPAANCRAWKFGSMIYAPYPPVPFGLF